MLQSKREFAVEFNSAFGGYFIISFFIFVKLYLELQFGSFISMKGGSKIDGSHLEPIADRDYMARGEHDFLRKMKNIQNPKLHL